MCGDVQRCFQRLEEQLELVDTQPLHLVDGAALHGLTARTVILREPSGQDGAILGQSCLVELEGSVLDEDDDVAVWIPEFDASDMLWLWRRSRLVPFLCLLRSFRAVRLGLLQVRESATHNLLCECATDDTHSFGTARRRRTRLVGRLV